MYSNSAIGGRCRKILEDNGGMIAEKSRTILLEDPLLSDLRPPLEFIAKNWRDPLTPALIKLSCEAVGGQSDETQDVALAMSLMNLSFYIWDDIIDNAPFKLFKPTLFGKFGEETALIIGGLASAKAYSILNQMNLKKDKRQTVTDLFWKLWARIAKAEATFFKSGNRNTPSLRQKLWKIRTEAADLETCLVIGATIGNGSRIEVKQLGKYGLCLGIILELWKDFYVSTNLTAELFEKIRKGALPYSLLWVSEHSKVIQRKITDIADQNTISQSNAKQLVKCILETKVLDNLTKQIYRLEKKGKGALTEMKANDAIRTLRLFIELQPRLFVSSLSTLQRDDF